MSDTDGSALVEHCEEGTGTIMAGTCAKNCQEKDASADIADWCKHQVKEWILQLDGVEGTVADIFLKEDIGGPSLLILDRDDLRTLGVTFGPAKLIVRARDELVKFRREEPASSPNQPGNACKPYPFGRHHDTYRYIENNVLDIVESGSLDLIEPCHEYKAFNNTTDETKMGKFTEEVLRFAAACMNSRTNGTIHFGVGDTKQGFRHGQILGVVVGDKEAYRQKLKSAIDGHFEHKGKQAAQKCIQPPRFVSVLKRNMTSSDKCVIEVDVRPESVFCQDSVYHTYTHDMTTKKARTKAKETESPPSKLFYVREGGSTCNLLAPTREDKHMKRYANFIEDISQLSELRKKAEEKHLRVIKTSTQGSRLTYLITGGTLSLDKSHFEQYVIVTNKSHPSQLESLGFLVELNPKAVLDFDPESAKHGLQNHLDQMSTVTVHSPGQYKITEAVENITKKLKLTRKFSTSWIFCNGRIDHEPPSDIDQWSISKGASVRDAISFLCRKDVLPNKRFLVIFLLLSTVTERMDPLVDTFRMFSQELSGDGQILCICDNEKGFTSWRDLIEAQCAIDISGRCIFELSFAEVNGTILSLWSKNRISSHFLPCDGGGKVLLDKKVERSLDTLEVLCVNQCEGGSDDKMAIEENFYRGGEVSWWNFYFSEQPGSTPFIKRDMFDYIKNTVIPDLRSLKKACVLLNLMHVTGCGGTTLAMHILWDLRDRFRCAVLRNNKADFAEVSEQVVRLLLYDHGEKLPSVPVLLMVDDFDDVDKICDLQQAIEAECVKKGIRSKSTQVILLNCMTSQSIQPTETTADTVFIGNSLSDKEQKMFEEKLSEIERTHKNAKTFYAFMIMKRNFKSEYIESVVHNTLKSFEMNQKPAQLLAVLVLLNVYCKGASLSISLCEDFLGLQPKPVCGANKLEDGFGKFSPLIVRCSVEGEVVFTGVRVIHPSIAKQCLHELATSHNVNKAEITDLLLTTDKLYESTQGKGNLLTNVHYILVKRLPGAEDSKFSPLIHDIARETPGLEEMVLQNAFRRFKHDAVVMQLLSRYYYLNNKNFSEAKCWAKDARKLSRDSSYIADTSAQVIKHELKNAIENNKEETLSPETLRAFLKMAQEAIEAFKETQRLAKKESVLRLKNKSDNGLFNTSGCLGEVQVGVLVINVLKKIPVFSSHHLRHDIMSQILSGDMRLQDIQRNDPRWNKNTSYYFVLQQFEDVLSNLKYRMKVNFDFLDNFYVNLGFRSGMRDRREQETQKILFRCFEEYVRVFCKTDTASLMKNRTMYNMLRLHQTRQFLEKEKADTYSGIMNYLSDDASSERMERIVREYQFVIQNNPDPKDRINFIFANVVLSRINLGSQQLWPYQEIINLLLHVLEKSQPISDKLPLFFVAVVLLWPARHIPVFGNLRTILGQLKTCYHSQLKEVYNGKAPVIHFLLGNKVGYDRLVHVGEIKRRIGAGEEQFASLWGNGKIWKERKVAELLCRVPGQVRGDCIWADTCVPDLKIEVAPMFRSQISGSHDGLMVSFFLGFTMRGPVALDIAFEEACSSTR